jgi:hypothetical protein
VFTSCIRIAAVFCTRIVVIAVKRFFANALAVIARVVYCADITVIALGGIVRVNTPGDRVAAVGRANVIVGTRRTDIGVNASLARIAIVVSTRVSVVAVTCITALAYTVVADIAGGTGITVIAWIVVVLVHASGFGVAAVVGAAIVVVAVAFIAYTRSRIAAVFDGTRVTVITF